MDYRSAVVNHVIYTALHHLAVEVGDLRIGIASSGAEFLKHLFEGHIFTHQAICILQSEHLGVFLAGLALAQEEELVIGTIAVKHGATGVVIVTTDAHTISQQLHKSDIIREVLDNLSFRGEG